MKRKNQIIKRISAFLCACFMFLCCLPYEFFYASDNYFDYVGDYTLEWASFGNNYYKLEESYISNYECNIPRNLIDSYGGFYVLMRDMDSPSKFRLYISNTPLSIHKGTNGYVGVSDWPNDYGLDYAYKCTYFYSNDNGATWSQWIYCVDNTYKVGKKTFWSSEEMTNRNDFSWTYGLCETNHYVLNGNSYGREENNKVYYYFWAPTVEFDGSPLGSGKYNSELGYIQNVTRKSTYIRDALYNYDEDSLTIHWTHDLLSSTGLDLSSGSYKIRHYISKATVEGYEKEDIIEMSDKYLVGEYDASSGGFSYLKKDYDDKITELGYENIDWIDKYLRGYFVLEHNYFQIVNTDTNEVGGYLHFYPKDANGDSFGVEYEYEGLNGDFEVDEDGPSGFIDNQTGSGLTHDEALDNADQPKLDDLSGVDELTTNLDVYAEQIGGVTNGIGALFGALPPWIVGLLGLSVALSFAVVVFKVLRG